MTTTAILCIARNESPFFEEWAAYHLNLGFDRLYYVSTDDDPSEAERLVRDSPFSARIVFGHFNDFRHGWQMQCYQLHRPLIEEDWVLVIDLDEFLYLHPFSSIHEYLETIGDDVGQVQFPWLLLMSSAYCSGRVLDIVGESSAHLSDHVKSMVRVDCASWIGIHKHNVDRLKTRLSSGIEVASQTRHAALLTDHEYVDNHPYILHFASRGHLDVLNRIMDHQFFNSKSGDAERQRLSRFLLGPADWSNLPTRCLLMQFYSTLPRVEPRISLPVNLPGTDLNDLRDIFGKLLRTIVDFEDSNLAEIEEGFEQRFLYDQKLSSLDARGAFQLDEYVNSQSQEGFVNQVRRRLTAEHA